MQVQSHLVRRPYLPPDSTGGCNRRAQFNIFFTKVPPNGPPCPSRHVLKCRNVQDDAMWRLGCTPRVLARRDFSRHNTCALSKICSKSLTLLLLGTGVSSPSAPGRAGKSRPLSFFCQRHLGSKRLPLWCALSRFSGHPPTARWYQW